MSKTVGVIIQVFIIAVFFIIYLVMQQPKTNVVETERDQNAEEVVLVWPAKLVEGEKLEPQDRWANRNYYIIFDGSGSMMDKKCSGSEKKIDVAKKAVIEFIESVPKDANLGLAVFDGQGLSERVALGVENRESLAREISMVVPDENTPLKNAIRLGVHKLSQQSALQQGYGEYHLIVVTDGEASKGQDPSGIVNSFFKQTPIVLHTIGFCIGEQHSLNQAGKALYQAADSPEQLKEGLKEVLAEAAEFTPDQFKQTK
jgi:hypothetical protein